MLKHVTLMIGAAALVGCMQPKPPLPADSSIEYTLASAILCEEFGYITPDDRDTIGKFMVQEVLPKYAHDSKELSNRLDNLVIDGRLQVKDDPATFRKLCLLRQKDVVDITKIKKSNAVARNNLVNSLNGLASSFSKYKDYNYKPLNVPAPVINGMPENKATHIMVNTGNGLVSKSCIKNGNTVMCQ